MTCQNYETYYRPKGYDYVETKTKCGNTKVDGTRAICDACRKNRSKMREIERQERNIEADNAWSHSAGWGDW